MNGSHSRSETTTPAGDVSARSGVVRRVLWVLLAGCAAGDLIAARSGVRTSVGLVFGLGTLGCAAVLIVQHYRMRRG